MNSLKVLFLIVSLAFSFFCFSQSNANEQPLTEILKELEKKYNVRFSFADRDVNNVNLVLDKTLTLKDALKYIEEKTKLIFNRLTNRFIAIEIKKEDKKTQYYIPQLLKEVYIENYLTKGVSKTIDGALKISPQKFGILPGLSEPDILQTIQTLPGITSVDERISNINVRGGTNDQNLILYEGIRMYQTGHFFGLISVFNPYLIESVDVTVNGTKAKYGSGVSSVISIENANEISKESKSGAGFNLLSVDGFTKFQFSKKTELQISARRSYTDALLTPTYDSFSNRIFNTSSLGNYQNPNTELQQKERFYFYDTSAKFLYDINKKSKIRANIIAIYNRLDYDVNPINSVEQETQSQLSQQSYAGNINYNHIWSNGLNMNAQFYASNYRLFANNSVPSTSLELIQQNEVLDIGARLDFLKSIDKNLKLNFGYQFNEVGVTNLEDITIPRFRRFEKEVIKTHGFYSEAEFTSNSKKSYLRVGLRGNYIEKFSALIFEPRIAFSQKFLRNFRLEILGESKNQSITQIIDLQQDFFGIEKRRWQLANTNDVPILKSNQFSLGVNYKNKGWLVSAEGYIKNVSGISTRSQGFQNQFQQAIATGNYNVNGVDLLINKQFKKFSTWLSYSYSKNDYEFEFLNSNNPFPNNLDIRHIVNFSSAYTINNLKLSAGINWHSGRPFTLPLANQVSLNEIVFNNPNAERVASYLRTDVSARYEFQFTHNVKAEVGASIWNLLNQDNNIDRFYTLNSDGNIIQNDEFALRLTPNFSFRLKF